MTTRRRLVAGNWKMNPPGLDEAVALARRAAADAAHYQGRLEVAVFPPTIWLHPIALELQGRPVDVGAQDSYWEPAGAFTGATSVAMVAGWCRWTLVGHSERRRLFGMTDDDVARSAAAAVAAGLSAMILVGEGLEDYQAGRTREVVSREVRAALSRIGDCSAEIAFAYEPVWAIGSRRPATPDEVWGVLDLIREEAGGILGGDARTTLRVLYGGGVTSDTIAPFTTLPTCDGALVGGASLDADDFGAIIRTVAEEEEG